MPDESREPRKYHEAKMTTTAIAATDPNNGRRDGGGLVWVTAGCVAVLLGPRALALSLTARSAPI